MITNIIGQYIVSHQQFIIGMVAGYATAHIPLLIHLLITSPWVLAWIKSHPKTADAIVDALSKEVHKAADAKQDPTSPA